MFILTAFAFVAGVVTILSPCILPILPLILATSVSDPNSVRRPYGIVLGFILSFTFFTLFLTSVVKLFGIPSDSLRTLSVFVIGLFGLSLLTPRFQLIVESLFSRLASITPSTAGKTGFSGGILIGLSIGLLWTPCVGPILASVIALALSGRVTGDAIIITLAYAVGTAIPMLAIILMGRRLFTRVPWLLRNTARIQKIFGVVMVMIALGIYLGFDRSFQTYILTKFPSYGAGLTKFEDRAFLQPKIEDMKRSAVLLQKPGKLAPDFIVGGAWVGAEPLSLKELQGKVVLVDFWTYTCINCQRTLPYLKSWDDKYRDQGLVIVGVHAPEFEFEKKLSNVEMAVEDFKINYPVMQDNNFATWRAYNNHYWPAKYLIDQKGNIRYTHFGEGEYDKTEMAIQQLLKDGGADIEIASDVTTPQTYGRTPETYLGSARGGGESYLSLSGKWDQTEEYNAPSSGSKLTVKYDAKSVYLVMRNTGKDAVVKVYVDGVYTKDVVVTADMLYTLVDLDSPGRHTLELEFVDDHAELFAFTFG